MERNVYKIFDNYKEWVRKYVEWTEKLKAGNGGEALSMDQAWAMSDYEWEKAHKENEFMERMNEVLGISEESFDEIFEELRKEYLLSR